MKTILPREKGVSTPFLVFFLILSCGIFMSLKIKTDTISRSTAPGSSIIYIPSGKYLKFATFGYPSLFADFVYLWAIQYYSDETIMDRFDYLDHIFSVISELDPHYLDPYEVGALIAAYEARDLDLAFKILDRGLEKNPGQWIFPFQAGHYAQMMKKDYQTAQKYFKKSMEIRGAPAIAHRLYANAAFMSMDYQTAWKNWLEIYRSAEDERIKKIASNHLYQAKAAMDTQTLGEAIAKFKEQYSRYPTTLSRLVQEGFLAKVPLDLDGKDYIYDPRTGEVKGSTIPWKR